MPNPREYFIDVCGGCGATMIQPAQRCEPGCHSIEAETIRVVPAEITDDMIDRVLIVRYGYVRPSWKGRRESVRHELEAALGSPEITSAVVAAAAARVDEATGGGALTPEECEFYARAALGCPDE